MLLGGVLFFSISESSAEYSKMSVPSCAYRSKRVKKQKKANREKEEKGGGKEGYQGST